MNTNYSSNFLTTMAHTFEIEGGFSNDLDDKGGATNLGISDGRDGVMDGYIDLEKYGWGKIRPKELSVNQALCVYWNDYWLNNSCDKLPPMFAIFVFDSAVQHRFGVAPKLLQTALGINSDGIIGPKTCKAAYRSHNQKTLSMAFAYRAILYSDIVAADSTQSKYLKGWFKRLFSLQQFILSHIKKEHD